MALNPANQGQSSYGVLAAAGVKFDFDCLSTTDLSASLTLLNTFDTEYAGSISAIEGPNEINNWPVSYGGLTGQPAGIAFQDALYSAVRADSTLSNLPVYSLTGNFTMAGEATDVNVHAYPYSGAQPYATLAADLAATPGVSSAAGKVLTEAGYYTLTDGAGIEGGVDDHTQATLELNLLMDATKLGYSQIYLYQLLDAYSDPNGTNQEDHFGLFDISNDPKPVAVAIHNLMDILGDAGSAAGTFATGSLNYSIANLPSTGASLLMEKSDGAYDIVVWNEPKVWNATTETEVAVAPTTVTVDLGGTFANVSVYDPLTGASAIATAQNASNIQVSITDHPLVIEVSGAVISSGGVVDVSSAVTNVARIMSGGSEVVYAEGVADGVVLSGGQQSVSSGGVASTTVVSSGGVEYIYSGGEAQGAVVASGGLLAVYSGGLASGGVVAAGGRIIDHGGGVDSGTVISGGGAEYICSGGNVNAAVVSSGGALLVFSGGAAKGVTVDGGGLLAVSSGGVASATTVASGGVETVYNDAIAAGTIVSSGGADYVYSGGVTQGAVVSAGGTLTVSSGGLANGAVLKAGGHLTDYVDGIDSGAVISSGGAEYVYSGGLAQSAVVSSGGLLTVSSGGVANGAVLKAGGRMTDYAGGVDSGAVISSGGVEYVYRGATANAAVVSSGGVLFVSSGGVASGVTVDSGGQLSVSSGGTLSGGLTLSGGTATIAGAVGSSATVTFVGSGGELVLGNVATFSGKIAGLRDPRQKVDLAGYAYGSNETAAWTEAASNTSGTLTITDGSKVAHLTLVGIYVTSNFVLSSDGHGGTVVVDPPVSSSTSGEGQGVAGFAQAMAAFGAEGRAAATPLYQAARESAMFSNAPPLAGVTSAGSAHG